MTIFLSIMLLIAVAIIFILMLNIQRLRSHLMDKTREIHSLNIEIRELNENMPNSKPIQNNYNHGCNGGVLQE